MAAATNDRVPGVRLVVSLYREFEHVARRGDMSMAQYRTLLYLLGGSRRAGELAAANAVTKPTVSAMINGLREQGWVRRRGGRDRRRAGDPHRADGGRPRTGWPASRRSSPTAWKSWCRASTAPPCGTFLREIYDAAHAETREERLRQRLRFGPVT